MDKIGEQMDIYRYLPEYGVPYTDHLVAVPLELKQTNGYVAKYHRHHTPVHRDKFRLGAAIHGRLVGVANVGRPVARALQDGKTVEVLRVCTNGEKNVCSFLYSRCAKAAKALGYNKIITYILEEEPGTALKAAGWTMEKEHCGGGSWDTPSRRRVDSAPTCLKKRFGKVLCGVNDFAAYMNPPEK